MLGGAPRERNCCGPYKLKSIDKRAIMRIRGRVWVRVDPNLTPVKIVPTEHNKHTDARHFSPNPMAPWLISAESASANDVSFESFCLLTSEFYLLFDFLLRTINLRIQLTK